MSPDLRLAAALSSPCAGLASRSSSAAWLTTEKKGSLPLAFAQSDLACRHRPLIGAARSTSRSRRTRASD
jgi:hypothetical protein